MFLMKKAQSELSSTQSCTLIFLFPCFLCSAGKKKSKIEAASDDESGEEEEGELVSLLWHLQYMFCV